MTKRKYHFYIKLKAILEEKGVTQQELSNMTGIRQATISEICNNARTTINKIHLAKIMDALNILELEDILVLTVEESF